MAANSVINTVSSFAALAGPVLGGVLYSAWGLRPVLWVCMACFLLSAIMELFLHIPFRKPASGGILETVRNDFGDSIRFLRREKPVIGKALLVICGINLFLSSMVMVGLPYLITEVLDLEAAQANRLYGFAEGALAAGGLLGGIGAGLLANRLAIQRVGRLVTACALCVLPIGASLVLFSSGIINYVVILICSFALMACSTVFTVEKMSFIQAETPPGLLGKVISVILTVSMCAQPLGNALYGVLFGLCKGLEYVVVFFAGIVSLLLAVSSEKIFQKV